MTETRKSKAKGLPPKVQLRTKDSLAASIPTGEAYVPYFDDMRTVVFTSYPIGLTRDPDGFNLNANYTLAGYSSNGLVAWYPMEHVTASGSFVVTADSGPYNIPLSSSSGVNAPATNASVDPQYLGGGAIYTNLSSVLLSVSSAGEGYQLSALSSHFDFANNNPFSFSAHIKFNSYPNQQYVPIVWRGIESLSFADWEIFTLNSGTLEAAVFDNSTGFHRVFKTNTNVITTGSWHHIAVTFNGTGTFQMYVDGVLQGIQLVVDSGWTKFTTSPTSKLFLGEAKDLDFMLGTFRSNLFIDQVAIFNRVITAQEVTALQTGLVFKNGLMLGTGLPANSQFLTDELTTDIIVGAPLRKGVGDAWIDPLFETFTPFRDSDEPAVDGKSTGNEFYATGSGVDDVGEGFDQPVWSKTKIEIDLTPSVTHSLWIQSSGSGGIANNNNYPMGYWNNVTKKYEGVGMGYDFRIYSGSGLSTLQRLLEDQPMGFGASLFNGFQAGMFSASYVVGGPITNFGFPTHAKFAGTSSNLIPMSDFITRPFLVEKMVLYVSSTFRGNSYELPANGIATFFLLNQRRPYVSVDSVVQQSITYYTGSDFVAHTFTTGVTIPTTYNGRYVDSTRDLITYWQASNNSIDPTLNQGLTRDFDLGFPGFIPDWDFQLVMSASAKSPNQTIVNGIMAISSANPQNQSAVNYAEKWNFSGRRGIPESNGRDYINAFQSFQKFGTASSFNSFGGLFSFDVTDKTTKINPYLLFPEDNLIFGFQIPYSNLGFAARSIFPPVPVYDGKGPEMYFGPTGIHKLVLYGSYINQDTEFHEDRVAELTSLAVHEVIG